MGKRKTNRRESHRHRSLTQNGSRRSRKVQYEEEYVEEEYKSYSQDIIPWVSYGNFCLTWVTVVPLVSICVIYLSSLAQKLPITIPAVKVHDEPLHISNNPVPPSQDVSLFEPYSVDYWQLLEIRDENMKKYSYNYSDVIDRRVNLSLEEYRDVYDGKW